MREYHHLGIPTTEPREGEKYVPHLKIYVWGYDTSEYRIEWVRFAKGAESFYHPLILKLPHIAFRVDNLEKELKGKKLIWGPYERRARRNPAPSGAGQGGLCIQERKALQAPRRLNRRRISSLEGGVLQSLPGFTVAFIEENGAPVELIETRLTEEEILGIVKQRD